MIYGETYRGGLAPPDWLLGKGYSFRAYKKQGLVFGIPQNMDGSRLRSIFGTRHL